MLDNQYKRLTKPDETGAWHVDASCNANAPVKGSSSDLYNYEGTWTAPNNPGSYELAVSFRFEDRTTALAIIVDYLVNMQVVQPGQAPPRITSHIHDQISLTSGVGTTFAQNTVNNAYDLQAIPDRVNLSTEYDWASQPVAGDRRVADGLLSTIGDTPPTFANVDESSGGGGGRGGGGSGSDGRIALPTLDFPYTQLSIDRDGTQTLLPQHGVADFGPYSQRIGAQGYAWRSRIDAPVTVRQGGTYRLKVGRYVMDNGFFGALADGSNIANFGDGQSVAFYADPQGPYYDPTGAHCDHDPRRACIWWTPVPDGVIGRYTIATYYLSLVDAAKQPTGEQEVFTANTTADWADVDASRPATYRASVQVTYTFADGGRSLGDPLFGAPQERTLTLDAAAGPTATPTATPPATATPSPAPPTDTPSPIPPTATPTPAVAAGVLTTNAPAYAWISDPALPSNVADGALPSTRDSHNPAYFSWPAGRPVRLLPAVSDHADAVHLTLHDLGNGAITIVTPARVLSQSYTLDGGACAGGSLHGGGDYAHDPSHFPAEVAPRDGSGAVLPGGFDLVWLGSADTAGAPSARILSCDLAAYLGQQANGLEPAGGVPLRYTVTQTLEFDITFAATVPSARGGATICPLAAVTSADDPSGGAFASAGYRPADARGRCPGGDVGLRAVETMISAGGIASPDYTSLALDNGAPGLPYTLTAEPDGSTTLRVVYRARRSLVLHYHIIQTSSVAP